MMKVKTLGILSKFCVCLLILSLMSFSIPNPVKAADPDGLAGTDANATPGDLAAQDNEADKGTPKAPAQNTAAQGSAGSGATDGLSPMGVAGIIAAAGVVAAAVAISLGGSDSPSGPAHK